MPEISEKLQAVLGSLPHRPGIYLHKDAEGHVLYVGKAADLRQRVRQYFVDPSELSPKNRALVAKISDIEFIVVDSEIEALILENEYIKRHQPKYNILLRDDKNYPYIKVSLTEDFPRIYRVRSFRQDGNRYFGPYTSSAAVDSTLDLMNKLFPYRTCRYDAAAWAPPRGQEQSPPAGWKQKLLPRPCTQYYIHRCNAPCVGAVSRTEYDAVIRQVILFLEGKHDVVLSDLKEQMREASENLEFERAAALRDRVRAVEQVLEKQKIINTTGAGDQDVIALAGADDETCAQVFFFRGGKLAGREYFILRGTADSAPGEIMASFIQQFYSQAPYVAAELILQHEPEEAEALRQWLRQKRGAAVTLSVPQRGDKLRLVAMVAQNAGEVLEQQRIKWLSDSQKTALALDELREALDLPDAPQRIECYDTSNIQGTSAVGSMVVFEAGRPKTADYRRFRIKTIEGQNDVGSLQEVLRRRFKRMVAQEAPAAETPTEAAAPVEPAGPDGAVEMEPEAEAMAEVEAEAEATAEDAALAETPGNSWAEMPDLLIMDGGRPQLNAALAVLDELGVALPVIGIAKEDHGQIGTHEEIYLPGRAEP
ncbi:MAG TPA: excinuclease ABC subunit UvrC, partial [Ktedonobacterales bacterium]|nr:excinuclease ABC subunit UvrC [Ktedonobacterales bacterium]